MKFLKNFSWGQDCSVFSLESCSTKYKVLKLQWAQRWKSCVEEEPLFCKKSCITRKNRVRNDIKIQWCTSIILHGEVMAISSRGYQWFRRSKIKFWWQNGHSCQYGLVVGTLHGILAQEFCLRKVFVGEMGKYQYWSLKRLLVL